MEFCCNFFFSSKLEKQESTKLSVAEFLQKHGWVTICMDDKAIDNSWEQVFTEVFKLSEEEKNAAGKYTCVNNLAVGYRNDVERQFIECRITNQRNSVPDYNQVEMFQTTVRQLYAAILDVAKLVLTIIANNILLIDSASLLDLTDIVPNLILLNEEVAVETEVKLASSLLRICYYEGLETEETKTVRFGAHTDTSFITVALHSSVPGLEIADQSIRKWIRPEAQMTPSNLPCVTVFIGEYIELITKHRLKAAIHRVVRDGALPRLSCPMIIRGEANALINFHDPKYIHPGGADAVGADKIADFDDMKLRVMQILLDRKRKKCFEEHQDDDSNWVLSSFPVYDLPDA